MPERMKGVLLPAGFKRWAVEEKVPSFVKNKYGFLNARLRKFRPATIREWVEEYKNG